MTVGERVRVIRKELRLNQSEFGERIGVSTSTISLIEKDSIKATGRIIRDICKAYGISQEWLTDGEGEMHASSESVDDLVLSFTELLTEYPGILSAAKLASKHMTVDDWKRLNEIFEKVVGE